MKTLNELSTTLFMEELSRHGVRDVFIAPGSRSTPLVLACKRNPKLKIHTHFDERSLGFFALGSAKKSLTPSLIITTSGTAVANLLPAIVEAYYSRTALIVCTADRPPELINVGANQAINQKNIFQNFTCDNFEIPPPTAEGLKNILTLASHSFFKATSEKSPVHLNWMFREPLVADNTLLEVSEFEEYKKWFASDKPYINYSKDSEKKYPKNSINVDIIKSSEKILLVYGSLIQHHDLENLLKISQKLNAPVFCDVQNPLKFTEFNEHVLRPDLLLEVTKIDNPDLIIHIGGPLTSKKLNQFIEGFNGDYIQVHNFSTRLDPNHKSKTLIHSSIKDFALAIDEIQLNKTSSSTFLKKLKEQSQKLENDLEIELKNLNEMSLPYHLINNCKSVDFFVGSSMPIRDLERFGGTGDDLRFIFNRGASGIDGNIATAIGCALHSRQKTICLLGDQAFLYDLNSLALIRQLTQLGKTFHTIVVNNQGGGIFSFLPVAQTEKATFSEYFTHPHEWNLEASAEIFYLKYVKVSTEQDLSDAINSTESSIIEVKTDISQNVEAHRNLLKKLKKKYG